MRSRNNAYLPIQLVCILELAQVQRRSLPYELDARSTRRGVVKRDKHDVGQVHAAELHIKHPGRRMDLGRQTMRGRAKHHESAGQLQHELLALQDLRDMARDLYSTFRISKGVYVREL